MPLWLGPTGGLCGTCRGRAHMCAEGGDARLAGSARGHSQAHTLLVL